MDHARRKKPMSYLHDKPLDETEFPPFAAVKGVFGFVPNFFRAQTMRTDLVPVADKALLNFALKLNGQPRKVSRRDIDILRTYGFTEQQILETVVTVGFAKFANWVAFGLGTVPDFEPVKLPHAAAD
jgi:alkylhydroperoxidase family enzyme